MASFFLLLAVVGLAGCSSEADQAADTTQAAEPSDSVVIELTGADSASVYELLMASHRVETIESMAGAFVKEIDSVENGHGFFWLYSINDSMGQVACDKYITRDGDRVKWHFRRLDQ